MCSIDPDCWNGALTMSDDGEKRYHDPVKEMVPGYTDQPRPLTGYVVIMGAFNAIFAVVMIIFLRRKGGRAAEISLTDLILSGIAAHKISRLLAKDSVTSPLRAPFTKFEGPGDLPSEVMESPRGYGLQHAMGELVTCAYCMGQWVSAFFAYGLMLAPRFTRAVSWVFVIHTLSDVLNMLYETLVEVSQKSTDVLEQKANATQGESSE
jgi:hypothetical protein